MGDSGSYLSPRTLLLLKIRKEVELAGGGPFLLPVVLLSSHNVAEVTHFCLSRQKYNFSSPTVKTRIIGRPKMRLI